MTKILKSIIFTAILTLANSYKIETDLDAMNFFARFGYIDEKDMDHMDMKDAKDAIMMYQHMMGMNESGILDSPTMVSMNKPRCGNKDVEIEYNDNDINDINGVRSKRFVVNRGRRKWTKSVVTWNILEYSQTAGLPRETIDSEVEKAFRLWEREINLNFLRINSPEVDIEIRFSMQSHREDNFPFDGPGKTLAHAFYPGLGVQGDLHYDDHEKWTAGVHSGTNLLYVTIHEIGHSIGLAHSDVSSAIMAPTYKSFIPYIKLHKDDIEGAQALYGKREILSRIGPLEDKTQVFKTTELPPKHKTTISPISTSNTWYLKPKISFQRPDLCTDPSLDAITTLSDGFIYAFKGQFVFKIDPKGRGVRFGWPNFIGTIFKGLENDLDAALTRHDGKTFYFKGKYYWRSKGTKLDPGYPKLISKHFPGIPNDIQAAFTYIAKPHQMYFIKGQKYWRFDTKVYPHVSDDYPKSIQNLGFENIDQQDFKIVGAFTGPNRKLYFFSKDRFWKMNPTTFKVLELSTESPKSTWFGCDDENIIYQM